jgi:hypothetical protein
MPNSPAKPDSPDRVQARDNCEVCRGERGGVLGNENRLNGRVLCDYCTADLIKTGDLKAASSHTSASNDGEK